MEEGGGVADDEFSMVYNIARREVQDKSWPVVAETLLLFGFEGISPDDKSMRALVIPLALCEDFEARVVKPWEAAWRAYRASSRRGKQSVTEAPSVPQFGAGSTAPLPEDEAAEVAAPGDTVFTWGCLDWMSAATNAGKKENVRAALVAVHTPEILPPPEALRGKRIAQLASGGRHLLLVTTEGEAFAWGRGTSGCLGVIATGCAGAPLALRALALGGVSVASVACGAEHSCVISTEGALFSFGANKRGQLGIGSIENSAIPQRVVVLRKENTIRLASCGTQHTLIVTDEGGLYSCGAQDQGVLGQGSRGDADGVDLRGDCLKPTLVQNFGPTKNPVALASAGGAHNLVLTRAGQLFSFGAGSWGRLGLGQDNKDKATPTLVKAAAHLGRLRSVAAGHEHSLLLTHDGSAFQFGRQASSYQSMPTEVPGFGPGAQSTALDAVAAGRGYSMALDRDGGVWVWGAIGAGGALGLGGKEGGGGDVIALKSARAPTKIDALDGRRIVQLAAGQLHMGVLADARASEVGAGNMAVPSEERFGTASQGDKCVVCEEDGGGTIILCDCCNKSFHLSCHSPPLEEAPEGEWMCYNCRLEQFSTCHVCGMQDEISATLALCGADDDDSSCPYNGCCHIECMPPAERPKVEVDSDEEDAAAAKPAAPPAAAAAAADDDDDDDAAGVVAPPTAVAREASAGAPSKPKPAFGKPPEKLKYELTGYSWFCPRCVADRAAAGQPATNGPPGANGTKGSAWPKVPLSEMTASHRKLLKAYHELCKEPDAQQLRLLATQLERAPESVKEWFDLQAAGTKQREQQQQLQKLQREKLEEQKQQREREVQELMARRGPQNGGGVKREGEQLSPGDAKRRAPPLTAEVEKEIEEFKNAGTAAFKEGRLDDALRHYRSAADLDEGYVWTNAHTLHSNMSAVYAKQEKWEDSRQEAVICTSLNPNFAKGHSREGTALKMLGKLPEAVQCFQRALSLEPSNESYKSSRDEAKRLLAEKVQREKLAQAQAAGRGRSGRGPGRPPGGRGAIGVPMRPPVPGRGRGTGRPVGRPPTARGLEAAAARMGAPGLKREAPAGMAESAAKRPTPAAPAPAAPAANLNPFPAAAAPALATELSEEADAFQQKGNAAFKEKRYQQAVGHFTSAIQQCPAGAPKTLYSNRSAALVLAAKQVAEPDQTDQTPSAPGGLGAPLSKDALLGMALADADRVIAMEATWPKGHSRRGNALHVMGRFTEARTSYEEALRLDPTNSQVISSLKDVEKEIEKQAPQNGAA